MRLFKIRLLDKLIPLWQPWKRGTLAHFSGIMKGSLVVGSFLAIIGAIVAQEDAEEPVMRQRKYYSNYIHPLTNMPDSALDVVTSYVFPKYVLVVMLCAYIFLTNV